MPQALTQYCQSRLGLDPSEMSVNEFQQALPIIVEAMREEVSQRIEVEKAAQLFRRAYGEFIPNESITRDERVPSFEDVILASDADPNSILDSVFPE